ncbi:YadA C-terminal domain-containing protein [Candidatus Spongiihabitans sp.]|uniref:YadA C-terminal domain-containing protein n=1 Tax=Candidatus Spongiihabitans sp. TaxID=3101308 RepID=UPI003C7B7A35
MLSAPVYAQSDCDTGVTNTDACHTTHTELGLETTARESEDTALGGRIDSEVTDRTNADTDVRTDFATADTALGVRIDGVKTTADNAATDAALDTEISARQAADGTHTTDIAAVKTTADAAATQTALGTERTDRMSADGTHTQDIAAVKATADNAATQTALGTETTDRTNADTAVRGEFAAADLKLDGRIDDLEEEMSSGIAMSLAIQDIWIPAGKTSGLAFGSGFYNGRTAVALSGAVRTSPNLIFNGGIGVGLESGTVGGRIGTQYVW